MRYSEPESEMNTKFSIVFVLLCRLGFAENSPREVIWQLTKITQFCASLEFLTIMMISNA